MKPTLLLFPNLLGEEQYHEMFLPTSIDKAAKSIEGLIAESERGGRRFLDRFYPKKESSAIPIALYNEHTPDDHIDFLLEPLKLGQRWGFVADAGLPCVADPGDKLVRRARQLGIVIQAFVGPSSILMSLMLSGLPGQQFTFHGYLSSKSETQRQEILQMEKIGGYTHIFIEAPYRNKMMLENLLAILSPKTWLCIAWDLTLPTQGVVSQPIALWKKSPLPNLEKKNAIFLFNSALE